MRRRGVAGSSALMFSGTLVSRLLGMVRDPLLVGAAIGINYGAANAFAVANRLPNMIYMLVAGGVLNAVLVPQIVRAIKQDDDGGQAYVNRLLTLAVLGLGALTALLTAASAVLVTLFAADLPPQWYALAVTFGFWCIPQVFFYGMYTVLGQILNARGIFGPYMWAPALNNVVAIAGLAVYLVLFGGVSVLADPGDASIWTGGRTALLAGTATLGVAAQAVVLVLPLARSGFRFRPRLDLRGSGLGRASKVAMWVFAALAVGMISTIVISNVAARASRLGQGALDVAGNSAYNAAYLVYSLPTSLVVVSLVTALFTRISGNAATGDLDRVRADLSLGLRTVGVFTVAAAAILMVAALPVVRVVAATVSYTEAQSIARVAVAMLAGLVGVGAFTVVQRVYYAFEDARALFFLQLPITAVVIVGSFLALLLPPAWIVVGVGVAMAVSNSAGAALTYLGLRRHLRWVDGGGVLRTYLRLTLAVVPATVLGWGLLHLLGTGPDELSVPGALWRTVVVAVLMGLLYLLLLRALDVAELDVLLRPAGRAVAAVSRRVPGTPGRLLAALAGRLAPAATRSGDDGPGDGGPGNGGPDGGPDDGAGGTPGPDDGGPRGGGPDDRGLDDRGPRGGGPDEGPDAGGPAGGSPARSHGPVDTLGDARSVRSSWAAGRTTALDAQGTGHELLEGRYRLGPTRSRTVGGVDRHVAHDTILDRDVEALVMPATGARVAEVLDAARRAALVDDHRLLTVLDVGIDGDRGYVITEGVDAPDLAHLTAAGPLPPEQARAVVGEATAALETARRHGVRHLALRPEVLHVTDDGQVLLTGLSTDAVLLGTDDPDGSPLAATRQDATDLVRLLYLALTGTWPAAGPPVPDPRRVADDVPGDLDALCARTFAGDGPRSTGELIRLLAPWGDIDVAALRTASEPPPPPAAKEAADGAPPAGAAAHNPPPGAARAPDAGSTKAAAGVTAGAGVLPPPPGQKPRMAPAWLRVRQPEPAGDAAAEGGPPAARAPAAPAAGATPSGPPPPPPGDRVDPPPAPGTPAGLVTSYADRLSRAAGTATPPPPPPPDTSGWTPRLASRPTSPPRFDDIVAAPGRDAHDARGASGDARHASPGGAPATFTTLAGGTAAAIGSGAKRAAEATKDATATTRSRLGPATAVTREKVGTAVATGRDRALAAADARRTRAEERAEAERVADGQARPVIADDDLISAVDGPEVPFAERRINPTPVVLVAVGVLVLVLFLLSVRTLLAPPDPVATPARPAAAPTAPATTEAPAEPTPTPTPTPPPTEPAVAPVIAALAPLDPQGDGGENPDLTGRAMDGDPATFWRSRSYANPAYGMKNGIGLLVTFEQPSTVSRLEIDLLGQGGEVEVRATSAEDPTGGQLLAEGEMGPGSAFEFDAVEADHLVLWFPRLPVAASDGKNRIELAELRVG